MSVSAMNPMSQYLELPPNTSESPVAPLSPLDSILEGRAQPTQLEPSPLKVKGVRFHVQGNLLHFHQDELMQTIQDIYMKVIDNQLLFSVDGSYWKPFGDLFQFDCNLNFPEIPGEKETEIEVNFDVQVLN